MIKTYNQMYRTDKYSKLSSIIWPVWLNGWVFVYELSGCGFESRCSHLILETKFTVNRKIWYNFKTRNDNLKWTAYCIFQQSTMFTTFYYHVLTSFINHINSAVIPQNFNVPLQMFTFSHRLSIYNLCESCPMILID